MCVSSIEGLIIGLEAVEGKSYFLCELKIYWKNYFLFWSKKLCNQLFLNYYDLLSRLSNLAWKIFEHNMENWHGSFSIIHGMWHGKASQYSRVSILAWKRFQPCMENWHGNFSILSWNMTWKNVPILQGFQPSMENVPSMLEFLTLEKCPSLSLFSMLKFTGYPIRAWKRCPNTPASNSMEILHGKHGKHGKCTAGICLINGPDRGQGYIFVNYFLNIMLKFHNSSRPKIISKQSNWPAACCYWEPCTASHLRHLSQSDYSKFICSSNIMCIISLVLNCTDSIYYIVFIEFYYTKQFVGFKWQDLAMFRYQWVDIVYFTATLL